MLLEKHRVPSLSFNLLLVLLFALCISVFVKCWNVKDFNVTLVFRNMIQWEVKAVML